MFEGIEDHREQAMAYYGNDLSPEERTAFEAHLATCPECQQLLQDAREKLPLAEQLLALEAKLTSPKSIAEQVARFETLRAEGQAAKQARQRVWRVAGYALAAAVAAVLAVVAFQAFQPTRSRDIQMAPPMPPK